MSATGSFILALEEGFDYFLRDWDGLASREPILDRGVIRIGAFVVQPVPKKDYQVSREIAYWKVTRKLSFWRVSTRYMTWRRKTVEGAAKLMRTKW